MPRIPYALVVIPLASCGAQTAAPKADPCASGPTFEVMARPAAFDVSTDAGPLGVLTVGESGAITFAAADGAPAEWVVAFENELATFSSEAAIEQSWSKETMEGQTRSMYACVRAISRDAPEYPGAVQNRARRPLSGGTAVRVERFVADAP